MQQAVMQSRLSRIPVPVRRRKSNNKQIISNQQGKGPDGVYTSAPVASTKVLAARAPRIRTVLRNGRLHTIVTHREFIGDISGSAAFTVTSYPINPGLADFLPWLSLIGNNWESYIFKELRFMMQTTSPSTTPGSVLLAIDFDAADTPPLTKQQLMSYHNAVRTAPWSNVNYDAARKDLLKFGVQRYTRPGDLAANLDIKTYDVGNLFVATTGQADTAQVGELYCEYEVEFYTPQSNPSGVLEANSKRITATGTVSGSSLFGSTNTVTGGLSVTASANTLTFNRPGQYMVVVRLIGTGLTTGATTFTGTASATLIDGFLANSTTNGFTAFIVSVLTAGQTCILSNVTATTVTSSITRIGTYAYSLG